MKLKGFLGRLEGGMIGEDRFEPCDPVEPFASFSVRDAFEIRPQFTAYNCEHFSRVGQGNTAYQVNVS